MFGRYPCCDYCNNALRFLIDGEPEIAFEEIVHAIRAADGYFHEDLTKEVEKRMRKGELNERSIGPYYGL